ncbi:MAG: hypothetical protein M3150_02385 [Pseudomonadota bacterium]|nr:hypothetical protein [Pseudomonadota bacterium]
MYGSGFCFLRRAALAGLITAANVHAQAPASPVVQAVGDSVIFNGRIDAGSAAQFLRLLQDLTLTRLVITSRGGDVAAALDMALAIHERHLDVEVPTVCLSSCANYIFPAAGRKTLGRPGAVAWHGNMHHVLYLQQTGQASWSASEMESARQLARREAEFYSRIGVDGFVCWFGKLPPYNFEDFYSLSVQDMERFGIREVTVRENLPGQPQNVEVTDIRVDWTQLEAIRPAVRLDL